MTTNTIIAPQEIFKSGEILTVAKALELKGKKIATTSPESWENSVRVNVFIVGEMVSDWDLAAQREYPNQSKFKNYQDYWRSYMSESQIDVRKTTILLLSEQGEELYRAHTKYSNFYNEPTFTGSDADREVYYVQL